VFDLKKPCSSCPFRTSNGAKFGMYRSRLQEISTATAFQCHKTSEDKPMQCAGLMSVLHKDGIPNAIMQVSERMTDWRAEDLDHSETYGSIKAAIEGHNHGFISYKLHQ
jgi:hypothetical protein